MKNTVIFASSINGTMSDYRIHLDDDLVTKAEQLFGIKESFQTWLQKKVEQWLQAGLDNATIRALSHNGGLSDEALAEKLKDYPPLTQEAFPDLSKDEFIDMAKSQAGRLPEGLEKWL